LQSGKLEHHMRDWIIIVLIAILGAGLGYWAVRSRSRGAAGGASAGQPAGTTVDVPVPSGTAPTGGVTGMTGSNAPNTGSLAVLEFEGEPGRVTVMRPEVVIGRHSEDDIQIRDVRVSRHHARLVARRDGGFEIHNLTAVRSEPNPMQVNGVTREHASLQDGDIVSLGGVSFTLWLKAA
jgi:pSer/pThr/pTyr-binding forkhead associated (FHA) protein